MATIEQIIGRSPFGASIPTAQPSPRAPMIDPWDSAKQAPAPAAPVVETGPTMAQRSQTAAINAILAQYGLTSLGGVIEGMVREGWGADAIFAQLQGTAEWKARFPAMAALAAKGRSISAAEYIDYERTMAQLERRYGLAEGLLLSNVTSLLENERSAAEIADITALAVADSYSAPDDLRQQIYDFYGGALDPDTALRSYYLDPDMSLPVLEKQSAAARIAVQGRRQGFNSAREYAEELAGRGVTEAQAQQGYGTAATQQSLTYGRGDTASSDATVRGQFGDLRAAEDVLRAQQARMARFGAGGGYAGNQRGLGGLGSSSV